MIRIFAIILPILWAFPVNAVEPTIPHTIKNFAKAKKLAAKVFQDHRSTFYCKCSYNDANEINPYSCGLVPRENAERASRIEWEHIVPAHAFGNTRQCWREPICNTKGKSYKGRRCCTKTDPVFRAMEADLHNLVPAVGELNPHYSA